MPLFIIFKQIMLTMFNFRDLSSFIPIVALTHNNIL